MADRRMLSKKIVDTDAFLDMSASAQNLYFHLNIRADDEGFVGNPLSIMRTVSSTRNDLDLLIAKKFIIAFDSGVIVIKHWKINNYLQNDRIKETTYLEEKGKICEKDNKSYVLKEEQNYVDLTPKNDLDTKCIQTVYINKNSIEENNIIKTKVSKEKNTKKENLAISYFECEILNQLFLDFLEMRKALKTPNTDRAIQMLVNKINQLDNDLKIPTLEKCLENGWKGIYDLREDEINKIRGSQNKPKTIAHQNNNPKWLDDSIENIYDGVERL